MAIIATVLKPERMIYKRLILILCLLFPTWHVLSLTEGEGDKLISMKGSEKPAMPPSIFILDRGLKPLQHLVSFMIDHNRTLDPVYVEKLVKTYIKESEREGINYEVAVCQMCLETGFLRFDGTVSRFQNNFCGLGATDNLTAGDWFRSMEEGVRAHIQHLKAYASIEPIKTPAVDKRFGRVRRGTVFTIYDLTGRWATDPEYGIKIDALLKKLYTR